MSRYLKQLLKLVITIGSLLFVVSSINVKTAIASSKSLNIQMLIIALSVFLLAQLVSSMRCMYISKTLGKDLTFKISTRAHFVGLWFNQVMPTSLGGDVFKVAVMKPKIGLNVAIKTSILDRFSGGLFLLFTLVLAFPFYLHIFQKKYYIYIYIIESLSFFFIIATLILAWLGCKFSEFEIKNKFLYQAFSVFLDISKFRNNKAFFSQFWTSGIVHFNGILTFYLLALALGFNVDFLIFVLVVPLVFLIALIPLSFAGWGIREAGAMWIFGAVGMSKEDSVMLSVIYGVLLIIAALPGLYFSVINDRNENFRSILP